MFGISKGFGRATSSPSTTLGNVTFGAAAEIDLTGDNFSGDITVLSDALITVNSRLRTACPVDR